MPTLSFTPTIARHVQAPSADVDGATLRDVLDAYFRLHPAVRSYVLDDQGAVRKHVAVFINQELIRDRRDLGDSVGERDDVFVAQALSGG